VPLDELRLSGEEPELHHIAPPAARGRAEV
jgi:hypothetical protein